MHASTVNMAVFGEVNEVTGESIFEWKLKDFFSLSAEVDSFYNSPSFTFAGVSWHMDIFPNGQAEACAEKANKVNTEGHISLYLMYESSGPPIKLKYSLGVKTLDGKIHSEFNDEGVFESYDGYGSIDLISRAELLEKKSELVHSDVLSIICKLKHPTSSKIDNTESLGQDFKKVLLNGTSHDVILKTGDKELRAHQDILKARSRVFESMLNHDMKEKHCGVVDVPDCDSDAMEQFLLYIYSGKVEKLDQSNMIPLYYIADKYEIKDLKEICSEFMKQSFSPSNLCEIIQLAVNHSDSNLQGVSTEYFINNMLEILRTVEWQSFMKDNSTVANELLIKSCEKKM